MSYELMTCKDDLEAFLKKHPPKTILWSLKLDGVRCAANPGRYQSRNLKLFPNFGCFDYGLRELGRVVTKNHGVDFKFFDGEVISSDKSFDKLTTQLQRKYSVDDSFLHFKIFDICVPGLPLYERLNILQSSIKLLPPEFSNISLLQHRPLPNTEMPLVQSIHLLRDVAIEKGYEGLVLKYALGEYEHKQSSQWCKVKKFHTLDLPVVGRYEGKTGKNKGKLGGFLCLYKGVISNVGGGFSDDERIKWWECPESELPSVIEVKYQEITKKNKLRFSDYVRVRDDKDEVDG